MTLRCHRCGRALTRATLTLWDRDSRAYGAVAMHYGPDCARVVQPVRAGAALRVQSAKPARVRVLRHVAQADERQVDWLEVAAC